MDRLANNVETTSYQRQYNVMLKRCVPSGEIIRISDGVKGGQKNPPRGSLSDITRLATTLFQRSMSAGIRLAKQNDTDRKITFIPRDKR